MARVITAIGFVLNILASLQVGGAYDMFPPKVTAVLIVVGSSLAAFSERMQGGTSKQ